jgi:hypothetical protein
LILSWRSSFLASVPSQIVQGTTLVFEPFDDNMDNLLSGEIATTLRDPLTCSMWMRATGSDRFAFIDYAPTTPCRVRHQSAEHTQRGTPSSFRTVAGPNSSHFNTQTDALNNIEIAADMKKDSTSMNAIAGLTMVFLLTFTAVRASSSSLYHQC